MSKAKIGIIGGSGLYKMEALKDVEEIKLDTPFGSPPWKCFISLEELADWFSWFWPSPF